jgi:hypothetical protein
MKESMRQKRYNQNYKIADIKIRKSDLPPADWSIITNNSNNREQYKAILGELYQTEKFTALIPVGKTLIINGPFEEGFTLKIARSPDIRIEYDKNLVSFATEADVKIYQIATKIVGKTILIVSLDTDALFIGMLNQEYNLDKRFWICLGTTTKIYCDALQLSISFSSVYEKVKET